MPPFYVLGIFDQTTQKLYYLIEDWNPLFQSCHVTLSLNEAKKIKTKETALLYDIRKKYPKQVKVIEVSLGEDGNSYIFKIVY